MNSWHIAWLLVRRTLGRKKGIISCLLVPAVVVSLIVLLLGGAVSSEIRLEVVNRDTGPLGAVLAGACEARPDIKVHFSGSAEEAEERLDRQLSEAAVVLPESFTEDVLASRSPRLEFKQLQSNEAVYLARAAVQYEAGELEETAERLRQADRADRSGLTGEIHRIYQEKTGQGAGFRVNDAHIYSDQRMTTSIGILILFVMIQAAGAVSVILDDRQNQTLRRMFACPLRPVEIALGNLLGCYILGTAQIVFVLLVSRTVMRYDFGSDFVPQLLVMECFLLAALGIAASIGGFVKESTHISAFNSMIISPTCMLGGCFWPMEIMPDFMRKLANFVPQKWAIDAVSKLSYGAGLGDIVYHLGILLLFGVVLLSFGAVILKPVEEEAG